MVVWLDTSTTAKDLTTFSENQKKEIGKAINDCISNPESSYVDVVKDFINQILDSYKRGSTYLNDKLKNKIIELAKQINLPVPDGIKTWEDIKGWKADYVAPPSVSPAVPVPAAPVPDPTLTKKSTITEINGIKKRATVDDFKNAHKNISMSVPPVNPAPSPLHLFVIDAHLFDKSCKSSFVNTVNK
jgi:hypothetical protein